MFEKISAYEVFTQLLPGILLVTYIVDLFDIDINIGSDSSTVLHVTVLFCVSYFLGIAISRIGSLLVEPIFKKLNWLRWSRSYYAKERGDKKLQVLLKDLNMYRGLISLMIVSCMITILKCPIMEIFQYHGLRFRLGLVLSFIILFSLSYRKQSVAIERRIGNKNKETKKK